MLIFNSLLNIADDLSNFPVEITDLFIQCFSELSVQSPVIASLLSMVYKSNKVFPALVVEKLTANLYHTIQKDDVQVAKLLLRALAGLASSNCVLLTGPNSVLSLLDALNGITESSWIRDVVDSAERSTLDHQGQVTAFLVATTIPWVISAVNLSSTDQSEAAVVLKRILKSCERVCSEWRSPFEVDGQQALFHVGIQHATDCVDVDSIAG